MRMKLLYYNCTFALFVFRLHKLGIEAHAYAHYTSLLCLLCFAVINEAGTRPSLAVIFVLYPVASDVYEIRYKEVFFCV